MDSVNHKIGLQIGIFSKTILDGDKKDNCSPRKFRYFRNGNKYFGRKKCYRESRISSVSNRFLQHLISCTKEKRENENGDKFKTSQQFSKENTFQNGHNAKSDKLSETKRLGNLSRSIRCVPSCTNFSKTQTIHEVLCSKPMLSMENNVFWSDLRTKNFYQNSISGSGLSEGPKYKNGSLLGRLVNCESREKAADTRSKEMPRSISFSRFYDKQREINSNPKSNSDISRGCFSTRQGFSVSNIRENKQVTNVDSKSVHGKLCDSFRFSAHSRCNGLMYRIDSQCSATHEANTASFNEFLESNLQRYDSTNSNYTTSKIPSHVVEKFSEHAERPIYSVSQSQCYSHNRCFQKGFWGLHWDTNFSGGMEFGTERMAHQLFRDESSLPHSQTFSRSTEKQMYFDQERQHKCGSIYQSPRGDKVTQPLLFDMGTMANGNSKQCSIDSRTHYRQEEYFSRPTEQDKNPSIRVVSKQISSQADFLSLGGSSDRSFCILGQQTNRDFLHMDSTSSGTSFGCIDNFMGEHIRVCVSPNLSHSEDFAVYEAIPLSDYINSTAVAQETLVSRHSGVTDSASNQTSKSGGFVESTENPDLSPKSSNVESDCLASLDRNFQTEGFSKSARNLLTASWRKDTQRDYSKKFDKFNSWCTEKQINPYSATLNQVADFLAFLFESGLQYRTIYGYRSMLSAVLPPVQNCPVGQHPHISRLIKGVFHSRPPKTKLLPEWDLEIVLKALENKPFEPLNEASLKFVTLKTVFLTAITTFRRCSDLQSLRIDHESMKIQEKGITFIRHGLSKQDRQSHFGIKIHVPHFPERELLDPKRAINIYLDKTKNSRQKLEPSDKVKLFLAINEPHKPVATVTISNWIVQAIKTAYSDESLKVTAHSTRAIAPSWALYKGASTKSILDAADWSSESTFVKFYLRDLDSDKLLQ